MSENKLALLEKLAELEHKQWSHIIWFLNKEHMLSLGKWKSAYYLTLMKKPYSDLNEAKKESDREWARKVLAILRREPSPQTQEIQKLLEDRPKYEKGVHCKSWAYNDVEYWFAKFEPKLEALLENVSIALQSKDLAYKVMETSYIRLSKDHVSRRKFIKKLKEIRGSCQNLSLEKGHDMVPDLIKELLELLTKKGDIPHK